MPGSADSALLDLQAQVEAKEAFIDQLVATSVSEGRDLDDKEMSLITDSRDRLVFLRSRIDPLADAAPITAESRERLAAVSAEQTLRRNPEAARGPVEYRSAGAYLIDQWRAATGHRDAREALEVFHRAAAHQTTADNPGLIPERILGPVINFIDAARPMVAFLGPRDIPGGPTFIRPRVTQHTLVGDQATEKGELPSRKMLISRTTITIKTKGGYVNVSRQDIDWSVPSVMDIVIDDLAAQYAIETEEEVAAALAASNTDGPVLPAAPTSPDVSGALWTAAATAYSAVKGQGRLVVFVSPDMLGLVGPLFAPVNPQNAQSSGFNAGVFGQGAMGAISGISVVMSAALPVGSMFVTSTAAVEAYEQRGGSLQVIEPSVLGTQVAYYGYFGSAVLEPAGVIQITKGV